MRVIAAVIQKDTKYLLAKRPFSKRHGGLWEFPGGKIHDGESDLEAINRELQEEMDIEVTEVIQKLWQAQDPGSKFQIEFHEVKIHGNPKSLEHEDIQWIAKQDLNSIKFAPTDAKFVRHYLFGESPNVV